MCNYIICNDIAALGFIVLNVWCCFMSMYWPTMLDIIIQFVLQTLGGSAWLVGQQETRAEWRPGTRASGASCVTTTGISLMLMSLVDSSALGKYI